jgi:UDP-glucose 4,6-dehydratase
MSTDEVYGDVNRAPSTEFSRFNPTNPYAASKAAIEQFVYCYQRSFDLPLVTMRSNNVYGPMQSNDKVVPRFIDCILNKRKIPIHGDGSQTRNWLHVEDVCRAFWLVATKGRLGQAYNIGSHDEVSILQIAKAINCIIDNRDAEEDISLDLSFVPDRPHNDRFYSIDWTKIHDELGWSPQISFDDGMKRTVAYYVQKSIVRRLTNGLNTMSIQNSPKVTESQTPENERMDSTFLVYGHAGWIGQQYIQVLEQKNIAYQRAETRPGDDPDSSVEQEIDSVRPTHIVSLLGRTHGPGSSTIDYLEGGPDKLQLNVRDNLYAPMLLALLAQKRNVHFTYLGTGCIFEYEKNEDGAYVYGGAPHTENDVPNFFGSSYSVVKGFTDRLMHHMVDNTLNVRIRMPVSDEWHRRNFITKIASYEKVVDIPNSVTVLPELIPCMIDMAIRKHTGTINLVNPNAISHNQVLSMYKEEIDPKFEIKNFSLQEQGEILKAGRSNCELSADKLRNTYQVDDSRTAIRKCLSRMKKKRKFSDEGEK